MGNQPSQPKSPPSGHELPGRPEPLAAQEQKAAHVPGEGIRSLKTSQAFRALNFELYAKPNKAIMIFGVASITLTIGYLIYLRNSYNKEQFYEALSEEGNIVLRQKKSRWDS